METDENIYEKFVLKHEAGTFFQSFAFGEFQKKIPYRGKSWMLVKSEKNGGTAASCLVIKMKLKLGKCWLWVPYGPLGSNEEIFEDLGQVAKEERAVFARIEPAEELNFLKSRWSFKKSPQRFTPEHSLILDLQKSEGEILTQMKPKGRYNIQTAKRHGILVQQYSCDAPEKDFEVFYEILKKTGGRDGFGIHPKYFYRTLLKTLAPKKMASLFLAYHKETVVGGVIIVFYKDTATYYYGASSYEHRNFMAPYRLQWEAICEAKKRGMTQYDFLGIAPANAKNHSWKGVTEFKKKFGGEEVTYPSAFDLVYRPLWYRAIRLSQFYRR